MLYQVLPLAGDRSQVVVSWRGAECVEWYDLWYSDTDSGGRVDTGMMYTGALTQGAAAAT